MAKKKEKTETVRCPECNEDSPAGSETCISCGNPLTSGAAPDGEDGGGGGATQEKDLEELLSIPGVKKAKAEALHSAGYTGVAEVGAASPSELASIKGIGEKLASKIIRNAKEMVQPQEDSSLADWLAGEDDGLTAWLSGEERREAPMAEAAATPEAKTDSPLAKWLEGESESIDSWLEETTQLAKPEKKVPEKALRERESEVAGLRDVLLEKIRQIESGDFDAQALVDEVTRFKTDLDMERRRAVKLEEELENVKRGSIAVIKFIKKQQAQGIEGENLADRLATEMALKEDLEKKVAELEGVIASLREKAEKGLSDLAPEAQDLNKKDLDLSQKEAQLDAMERDLRNREQAFAEGLIDYAAGHEGGVDAATAKMLEQRSTESAEREKVLLEKVSDLEGKLSQAEIDLKHRDEMLKMAKGTSQNLDREALTKIEEAQRMERNLVLREQEVQRLKDEARIREDEMKRLKDTLAYKEDELLRREEDLMYRERLIQEESRKLSQMQVEMSSQDELTLKKRLEELQADVTAKEEEIRNKEKYLHVKEEELRIREQGLIDDEIEKRELDRLAEIKMEKVKTGTNRLDDLLLGGMPFGTNVMIYGPPFTGKEVLVNAFVAEGLKMGIPAVWIITEKSPKEIRDEMMYILSGYEEYEKKGLVRYIDTYSRSMGDETEDEYTDFIESPTDYESIQKIVESVTKQFKESHDYYRLAFRSISTMIAYLDPNTAFRFLSPIAGRRKRDRAVAMYTIEKGVHGEQEIQMLGSLMDGMIEFKVENLNTFLAVRGISDVQSRAFIRYSATKQGVNIGSFSLDHIR